ncbi:hypothetical protein Q0N88_07215 [Bacillus thuringiensis]|uniref:hypothetical protein n=1 Tax=Bacillus thuringiensis TaxID=1428 RepID=UPI00345893D9
MNKKLSVQTAYLVMVGNRFVGYEKPLMISEGVKDAMEFDYETAKKIASELNGVVVRRTTEYNISHS